MSSFPGCAPPFLAGTMAATFSRTWMRSLCLLAILSGGVFLSSLPAQAGSKPPDPQRVSVAQLEQTLAASHAESDADLAQQLSTLELTERLSTPRLASLSSAVPGEKSGRALMLLADRSAFLDPPAGEIPPAPTPEGAATRQMLVHIVNYVNTTLRQLPNLIASREITSFEDRPAEDVLDANGVVSFSYEPLHYVGKSVNDVTFRDRKEFVEDASRKDKHGQFGGLVTRGEFGPILSTVVGDALKGKIVWGRWERAASGNVAVFRYTVPEDKSNYRVQFCCVPGGQDESSGQTEMRIFDAQASYHGEITFNPNDGSILRMTLQADMPSTSLVPSAGIAIDYGTVEIAGRQVLCPTRSVSTLEAHIEQQRGMASQAIYHGATKSFLNDIVFDHYRRFGSESRILTGSN
jgi:hypothetical protein